MGNLQQKIRLNKIAKAKYHEERQQLDLRNVGAQNATLILTNNQWTKVKMLVISDNKIEDDHIARILQSPFPNVTELNLYTNCVTDQGLSIILDRLGPQLTILLLEYNAITEEGFLHLMEKDLQIQRLDLRRNLINLRTSYNKNTLKRLDNDLDKLKYLNLNQNVIGAKGCSLLAKMKLNSLEHLQIAGCAIGNEGVLSLGKSLIDTLQKIDLNRNYIGVKGLCNFIQLGKFKKLKYIHLNSNLLIYVDMIQILNWNSKKVLNYSTTLNSLVLDHFIPAIDRSHFNSIERILRQRFDY